MDDDRDDAMLLPPTVWMGWRSCETGPVDCELTLTELVLLARRAGAVVGGEALWDPRYEPEVRAMLVRALRMEGVLP